MKFQLKTRFLFLLMLIVMLYRDMMVGVPQRIEMMLVFYIGVACNMSAIYFNEGKMPVHKMPPERENKTHKPITSNTRLWLLCDVISLPGIWISIGDVLQFGVIGLGVGHSLNGFAALIVKHFYK